MIDINMAHEFGMKSNSVSKWAREVHDPISVAINDFPMRCMMVCAQTLMIMLFINCSNQCFDLACSDGRVFPALVSGASQTLAAAMRLRQDNGRSSH